MDPAAAATDRSQTRRRHTMEELPLNNRGCSDDEIVQADESADRVFRRTTSLTPRRLSKTSKSTENRQIPARNVFKSTDDLCSKFSQLAVNDVSTVLISPKRGPDRKRSLSAQNGSGRSVSDKQTKRSSSLPAVIEEPIKDVKVISLRNRDRKLLEFIENGEMEICQNLCLANESIIATKKLFALINFRLKELGDREIFSKKTVVLLNFCDMWLEENKNTRLIRKAQKQFNRIIFNGCKHNCPQVQSCSKNLSEKFKSILLPRQIISCEISLNSLPTGQKDFGQILRNLFENRLEGTYNKTVEQVAADLLRQQIQLYGNMSLHDLIEKKWEENSSSFLRYVQSTQQLCVYIIDSVVNEPDVKKRSRFIKFFLNVAQDCLNNNNYASASSICCALNHRAIDRLEKTFEKCREKKYKSIQDKLNVLFFPQRNFSDLRHCLTECQTLKQPHIPCLVAYMKDLVITNENCPLLVKTEEKQGDPQYNFEKLTIIKKLAAQCLAAQESLPEYGVGSVFETNFVSVYLASHIPLDDDMRDKTSKQIESK